MFHAKWDITVKAVCGDWSVAYTVIGSVNMITDFAHGPSDSPCPRSSDAYFLEVSPVLYFPDGVTVSAEVLSPLFSLLMIN